VRSTRDGLAWLAARLGFGAALSAVTGLATGVGGWIGVARRHNDIGLAAILQAAPNVTALAVFALGAGALLDGLAPTRVAVQILDGLVLLHTYCAHLRGQPRLRECRCT